MHTSARVQRGEALLAALGAGVVVGAVVPTATVGRANSTPPSALALQAPAVFLPSTIVLISASVWSHTAVSMAVMLSQAGDWVHTDAAQFVSLLQPKVLRVTRPNIAQAQSQPTPALTLSAGQPACATRICALQAASSATSAGAAVMVAWYVVSTKALVKFMLWPPWVTVLQLLGVNLVAKAGHEPGNHHGQKRLRWATLLTSDRSTIPRPTHRSWGPKPPCRQRTANAQRRAPQEPG